MPTDSIDFIQYGPCFINDSNRRIFVSSVNVHVAGLRTKKGVTDISVRMGISSHVINRDQIGAVYWAQIDYMQGVEREASKGP